MLRRTMLISALAAATPAAAASSGAALPPALDQLGALALETFEGAATTLGEHLPPGPAVISFWASWCAPCIAEAQHLTDVRRRLGPSRLAIVGLNVELIADQSGVRRFLDRTRPNYTQLRADMAAYHAFGGHARELTLPRLFVFAADGRPTAAFGAYNGATTFRAIDRAIEGVLS